jgi:putative salt-induced outer membrane protein
VSAHFLKSGAIAALLMFSVCAQAQWTGKAELGFLQSGGNTESTSANTKLDMTHEGARWKNNYAVAALYSDNGDFSTAERYEARYQADYKINDKLSWFGALRGEQDRFSGFAYQATVSTGASYKFIDHARTKLDASLGVGYKQFQEEILVKSDAGEVLTRIDGVDGDDIVGTLGVNYEHAITDTTKLTNKLLTEFGSDNTAVQNDIALAVNINEKFALAVGFGIRYNSDPPPLSESTDTLTTINLVYNIK